MEIYKDMYTGFYEAQQMEASPEIGACFYFSRETNLQRFRAALPCTEITL